MRVHTTVPRGRLIGRIPRRGLQAIRLRRMPGDVGVSPTFRGTPFSVCARVRLITLHQ